jgi:hypothetical protein
MDRPSYEQSATPLPNLSTLPSSAEGQIREFVLVPPFNSRRKNDQPILIPARRQRLLPIGYSNELISGKHAAVRLENERIQIVVICFCVYQEFRTGNGLIIPTNMRNWELFRRIGEF